MQRFMSVDCEEWFHAANVDSSSWNTLQQTVYQHTMSLLDLFARYNTTATFFILGDVALRHPKLIESIASAGHEIASHGFGHKSVTTLSQDEFLRTIVESKKILEDISGQIVQSYRAPNFSITQESLWALELLTKTGYRVDSSIAPIHNYRYGIAHSPTFIHDKETVNGLLKEVPVSTLHPLHQYAMLGGFYFRTFPVSTALKTIERNEHNSAHSCFYIHPWELSPLPNDARVPSRFQGLRMRVNLNSTRKKLECVLREFTFRSISIP